MPKITHPTPTYTFIPPYDREALLQRLKEIVVQKLLEASHDKS